MPFSPSAPTFDTPLNDTLPDDAPAFVPEAFESTLLRAAAAARLASEEDDESPTTVDLVAPSFDLPVALVPPSEAPPRTDAIVVTLPKPPLAPTVRTRPRRRLPSALRGPTAQAVGIFLATMLIAAAVFVLVRPTPRDESPSKTLHELATSAAEAPADSATPPASRTN